LGCRALDVWVHGKGRDRVYLGSGGDDATTGEDDDLVHGGSGRDVINGGVDDDELEGAHESASFDAPATCIASHAARGLRRVERARARTLGGGVRRQIGVPVYQPRGSWLIDRYVQDPGAQDA
jgi:Ca2+-binding RTX toxin-like protein